jgi:hypothetical protein
MSLWATGLWSTDLWAADLWAAEAVDDTTPDAFSFVNQTGVALSATITSAQVTITGIDAASPITVSGASTPLYSINGGAFTAIAGTVEAGDEVRARHTSSASEFTWTHTLVTIGGVSATFSSRTLGTPPEGAGRRKIGFGFGLGF